MAITLADFNKIWASSSPLTPYSFTENDYKQGWNFIGSTPPARQMWDYLQKNNDEKMQYLANNYLPLSGGTMTGTILSRYAALKAPSDDTYIEIDGGTGGGGGATLILFGKEESRQGQFWLRTNKTGTTHSLVGTGDGYLTWDGNNIITSAGGTFTGSVTVQRNNPDAGAFRFKYTNVDRTLITSTTYDGDLLWLLDKNNTNMGGFRKIFGSSGGYSYSRIVIQDSIASVFHAVGLCHQQDASHTPHFSPISNDNVVNLGYGSYRWKQLYAGTTTISTSDERLKDNIETIPDEVLDAWGEVNWYQYQFKDSIEEKGETKARIHTGAIAQRIESVFESHGLDANRYGLLCYDEWEAEEEQKDSDGNIVQEAREAGNRYSLRYEEALAMEAAYQRRRADRLEERIEALEKLLMNMTDDE